MPTHKSDIITTKDALAVSDKSLDGTKTGATVLQATAVYTVKGTEINGDIIELTDLPPSATVIPEKSYVAFGYPAGLSYGWFSLGDAAAPGRYGTTSIHTDTEFHSRVFGYVSGNSIAVPQPYGKATRIAAKFLGTPSGKQAGGKLVFGISYTIKG